MLYHPRLSVLLLVSFTLLVSGFLLPARDASAQVTVNLTATKDNTLYEDPAGTVSNGAGVYLFTGETDNEVLRRALIAFDIAASIPSGSTIQSVVLTMTVSRTKAGNESVALHKVSTDWGEGTSDADGQEGQGIASTTGDATWIHTFYPGSTWSAAGGDYNGLASATSTVGGNGPHTWSSAGMAADVQSWLDSPSGNFGWIVIGNETVAQTAKRFNSRENGSAWPVLEVTYTSTATDGACCLPSDSCAVLTEADCLAQGGTYEGNGTTCTPDPCTTVTGACCFDDGSCSELTAADCSAQGGNYQGDNTSCSPGLCPLVLEPFVDALPLPAVATPISGSPGSQAIYEIAMTQFKQKLHRDLDSTTVWGFGGSYPGPTIEAGVNEPVTVKWINDLRDSTGTLRANHFLPVDQCMHGPDSAGPTPRTVVHLHGGHVMEKDDGYPEATILPGQDTTYYYPNNQLPATLWYHDHAIGITRLNVIMGLAGVYLLRDAFEQGLGLPAGDYEIPLAIQDRTFNPDGSFQYPALWEDVFFGDKILVNGKVWPFLDVKRGKYRFRVLNGSNSRAYQLTLSTGDPFHVIGTEGGLLGAPVTRDTLTLTPGERYDVIVDFDLYSPGTEIILFNSAPSPFPGPPGQGVISDVMKFVVQGGSKGFTGPIPSILRPVVAIPESLAVEHRDFRLKKSTDPCAGSIWEINGLHWNDITEFPVLNTTEVWRFINESGMVHPMHMHLVMFQILDRQAFTTVGDSIVPVGPPILPDSSQAGWKDTVPVYPGEMVRVIATFESYTGKYAYHCHILEHEDHEMMRQFQVVLSQVGLPRQPPPVGLFLAQNQPNPFGFQARQTRISFALPERGLVKLKIFDITGREVRKLVDGELAGEAHDILWDGRDSLGRNVPSGIYIVRLEAGGESRAKKMVLTR